MRSKIKEKAYNVIAKSGIWFLHKFFPEYFAAEPLRPTDRYIEYPFILDSIPRYKLKVLDVGCSGSIFPLILQSLGYETYGIDIRNYYPEEKFFFKKGDITVSLYECDYFDIVTAISSIEHIGLKGCYGQGTSIDGDIRALKEIHRILKKGGLLLLTIPFGENARIEEHHKIYDKRRLDTILHNFDYTLKVEKSPEADYSLALIKAVKR